MTIRRAIAAWSVLFVLALMIGLRAAMAVHRVGCGKYADSNINFFNGGSGSYFTYYEQEARSDSNSWHNFTNVNLNPSGAGSTDHINSYNGFYGQNGWLGSAQIIISNGCTTLKGSTKLNQSYLDNGSYSATNKRHVACQEIGHLLGLDHNNDSTTTCMNDTILTAPQPNFHDVEMINSIY